MWGGGRGAAPTLDVARISPAHFLASATSWCSVDADTGHTKGSKSLMSGRRGDVGQYSYARGRGFALCVLKRISSSLSSSFLISPPCSRRSTTQRTTKGSTAQSQAVQQQSFPFFPLISHLVPTNDSKLPLSLLPLRFPTLHPTPSIPLTPVARCKCWRPWRASLRWSTPRPSRCASPGPSKSVSTARPALSKASCPRRGGQTAERLWSGR